MVQRIWSKAKKTAGEALRGDTPAVEPRNTTLGRGVACRAR